MHARLLISGHRCVIGCTLTRSRPLFRVLQIRIGGVRVGDRSTNDAAHSNDRILLNIF